MTERLEFRFLWNADEHRRFYRVMQRAVMRRRNVRLMYIGLLAVAVVLVASDFARNDVTPVTAVFMLAPWLMLLGLWLALLRWGMPYLSARTYARNHQACIPHDQVRVVSDDGIEARCVTSDVKIQWHGISRVLETPEFFLFFTTPNCAFQVPKRVVPSEQLDAVRQLAGRHSHIEQSPDIA